MRALLVALLLTIPSAAATEPQKLIDISADVVDAGQVRLALTYPGGACDKTGEAEVTAAGNFVVSVTIPTTRVGEVCTMQVVPVHFEQVIAVEPGTQTISATVLTPDGQLLASGSVDLGAVTPAGEATKAGGSGS
jgi:hypothetical protein